MEIRWSVRLRGALRDGDRRAAPYGNPAQQIIMKVVTAAVAKSLEKLAADRFGTAGYFFGGQDNE
jgi:hypothetical protein